MEYPTLLAKGITVSTEILSDAPEDGHVLFMDLVGYSKLPMDEQRDLIRKLFELARSTPEFQRAQSDNRLISLPTGDGMALIFFQNPLAPVQCALEIADALKTYPAVKLRMGIHSGPVFRVLDINNNPNVSGGGVNFAERAMDMGDAGHILLSRSVADNLMQLGNWQQYLEDLGEHEVKHGVPMRLFNLCKGVLGRPERPGKLSRRAEPAWLSPRAELLRHCGELFESLEEFSNPERLRAFFRLLGLETYGRCVPRSSNLDFDQLLDCLKSSGRDYYGQALVEVLDALASRYKYDYRRMECENLRDSLKRHLGQS